MHASSCDKQKVIEYLLTSSEININQQNKVQLAVP